MFPSKWTEKMDAAEKDIIAAKKQNWIDNTVLDPESIYAGDPHSAAQAADRKEERGEFNPKKGVLRVSHEHGFIVMDLDAFGKLPKSQQTKILKLGGN